MPSNNPLVAIPVVVGKRPAFFTGLFFAAGIFAARSHISLVLTLGLFGLGFFLAACRFARGFKYAAGLFCLFFLFGAARLQQVETFSHRHIARLAAAGAPHVYLGGTVLSDPESRDTEYGVTRVSFLMKAGRVWKADGKASPAAGIVKAYLSDPVVLPRMGETWVIEGEIRPPKERRNPGGFDQKAYFRAQGIHALLFGNPNARVKKIRPALGFSVGAWGARARAFLSRALAEHFGPSHAAVLKALFLGERDNFEEGVRDLFLKTGTIHILAVSGFNVGFLAATVFAFLWPLRLPRNALLAAVLGAAWVYAAVVGWQAPLVRATLMATLVIAAKFLGRKTDLLNLLGCAALGVLGMKPGQLWDVGFQLSFLAVIGIAVLYPRFHKSPAAMPNETFSVLAKASTYFKELFWLSYACLLVTLPVTVQNFYLFSPSSLLANLVVVPLAFLIFFCGAAFFLVLPWAGGFFSFVVFAIRVLMDGLLWSLEKMEHLPGSYWITGRLDAAVWVALVAGLSFIFLSRRFKDGVPKGLAAGFFVLFIFASQDFIRYADRVLRPRLEVTALDVGQGDSLFVEFPGGGNLLIDAGKGRFSDQGRWVVAPYLKWKGVRSLDYLAVSHPQEDHIGGVASVLEEFPVRRFLWAGGEYPSRSFEDLMKGVGQEGCEVFLLKKGDALAVGQSEIFVLSPSDQPRSAEKANEDSLVFRIDYKATRFLFTGDIGEKTMEKLLGEASAVRSDFLKVPHHGAKLGPLGRSFIHAVSPSVSVISAGERNPFRHPRPETIEILRAIPGNRIFRTDKDHAVSILSDGRRIFAKRTLSS